MSGTRNMIIGIIMIVLALAMFPVVLDSVDTLLTWTGAGGSTLADFTGLEALITITPLLAFIGLLFFGGLLGWSGFKEVKGGGGGRSRSRSGGLH